MEKQHQAVGDPLAGPDDEHVQVNSDGHGPEKGAGVGESGYGSLRDALQRVGVENTPDPDGVGDGGQPVRHREVHQQPPRSRPQIRPDNVGDDDERGAQKRQRARAQHDHLLRQVHNRPIPICHRETVCVNTPPKGTSLSCCTFYSSP